MKTALLALLRVATAVSVASSLVRRMDYTVKDHHPVPLNWTRLDRAPENHILSLRIGVKQKSFDDLERNLYETSDPDQPRYGQHLTDEDIHALIAPEAYVLESIHAWLDANGVSRKRIKYSPAKDWLTIAMPVREVELLLDTTYYTYKHDGGHRSVRTPQYSLPISLHQHIDLIQPTNYFGSMKAMSTPLKLSDDQPEADSATNTPSHLNQTANNSDFRLFWEQQRKDTDQSYIFSYRTIAGGVDNQSHVDFLGHFRGLDLEADLDSQTLAGSIYPTPLRVYSTGTMLPFKPDNATFEGMDTNEPYLPWLEYMLALKNPQHTISTSYADDEQTVPYAYAKRVCEEMAQLTAKGVSLFFSSGDVGVGFNRTCFSNNGSFTRNFLPQFPASCPYITAVGGTRGFSPEIVAFSDGIEEYVSGAGVSNYFPRPRYQETALSNYLSEIGDLHAQFFNHSGRGYPDVAAQGFHYLVTWEGDSNLVDGTSASAPTMASVVALLNDALLAKGKRPLGFLNPALYSSLSKGFTDIRHGHTWGCGTSGFPAKKGWDFASGWGTPNFREIRRILGV